MTSPVPPRDWTDIHWPDIAGADAARWIAVLPLAATEQHGPHLPLETDVLIGEAYLARVRELLPAALPVTFLPLQPVGISTEHIDYPGTLTLPTDVALKEWMAIGESVARSGIRKLVMVTSHGGNSAAMSLVAQDLRAHHRTSRGHHELVALRRAGWIVFRGRDCVTAFMAARSRRRSCWRAIRTVCGRKRSPIFVPPASRWRKNFAGSRRIGRSPFAWQTQDLHESGAVGDATKASAEKGERLLDHGARAFCELLDDVDKFDPELFLRKP